MLAYDDISLSPDGRAISLNGQDWLDLGTIRDIPPENTLRDPTILEQFKYRYPLEFDLTQRAVPFVDPGRLRNAAFFEALYFQTEQAARESLVYVTEPAMTQASFRVTRKRNVACQLAAALAALAASDQDYNALFADAGGSFNWRAIAGTTRLSTHSFGIAFDVNAEMGKYWLWTGAKEDAVGHYDNVIPESLVTTMERFGFIWGGKWHHFDGMHFEFRPELILYSRMVPD
ncbi:M15 family metallopeptidase [Thioclava sp. 15-R06ZXC-3]|uniref:M15 family metallopeptidase n=1 Tax=Thioclava arctica TaxID=3238301 RepID=A0ABV3TQT2_9RHOB